MHPFHPDHVPPPLWVLHQVLGLSLRQISKKTGLSYQGISRLMNGYQPSEDTLRAFRLLIREEYTAALESLPKTVYPILKEWQKLTFELVTAVQTTNKPPSKSNLIDALQHALQKPTFRAQVLKDLGAFHSKAKIIDAVRSLGVHEQKTNGRIRWFLPTTKRPEIPTRIRYVQPKPGSRRALLHRALERRFLKQEVWSRQDLIKALPEFRPTELDRAARELNLVRKVVGFGPKRSALWSYPEAQPCRTCQDLGTKEGCPDCGLTLKLRCPRCSSTNLIRYPTQALCKKCSQSFDIPKHHLTQKTSPRIVDFTDVTKPILL